MDQSLVGHRLRQLCTTCASQTDKLHKAPERGRGGGKIRKERLKTHIFHIMDE